MADKEIEIKPLGPPSGQLFYLDYKYKSDKIMKLFKISQSKKVGYDTYDSAIVAAEDDVSARSIHPSGLKWSAKSGCWCAKPEYVTAEYIGEAAPGIEQGVILASYNAG